MKKISKLFVIFFAILIIIGSFCGYLYLSYTTPILMYHSFDPSRIDTYAAITPEVFREQMQFIEKHGYRVISLQEYCRLLKNNQPPGRNLVVITFDDGYNDNLAAVNILKEFNYPATIFIIVYRIGQEDHLSSSDISWVLQNSPVKIGSHTLSHPDFTNISDNQLKREIWDSKMELEALFSQEVSTLSYPTGIFNEKALNWAEDAGFICACSTNRGFSRKLNRFALRRIKVTNRDTGFYLWAKLSGFYNVFRKLKKPY
ncbi:MAG: polysaccharide deacetylase family protein [Candidatus Omnitrophica bacterium]|nr:polysaccharide deacetylase family protein [Candidatus Omnitrophota bacterium]